MIEYTIVQDSNCHNFIIPFSKIFEWNDFLNSEDYDIGIVPDWAKEFEGELVIFTSYRLGNL